MKRLYICLHVAIYFLPLFAQTENQLTVSEIRQQTILNEPLTLQKGYFRIETQLNYLSFSTDWYNNNWKKVTNYGYLSNNIVAPFALSYGITNNIELNISSSYKYSKTYKSYNTYDYYRIAQYLHDTTNISNGFADISISTIYQIVNENQKYPLMGIELLLNIPYGKKESTLSNDSTTIYEAVSQGDYDLGIGYLIKKVFYPFSISSGIGYVYRFPIDLELDYSNNIRTHVKYGDYLNFNMTLNYMPCDWIDLGNTISCTYNGKPQYTINNYSYSGVVTAYSQWNPFITFQIKNIRLSQGLYIYIIGKNTNATSRAYFSLAIKI